jgi:hypothetical protein
VDDTKAAELRVLPRVPPSWKGFEARHWPIRTRQGILRSDLYFEKTNGCAIFRLKLAPGQHLPKLAVRMPSGQGWTWKRARNVSEIEFRSEIR